MDGSSYSRMGDGLVGAFWLLAAAIPLAIWKLIDIAIWVASHVSIRFS